MEDQQNVSQPMWTTWWNHSCYTGIPRLPALHCLQQLQSGACSSTSTQPLSLTLDPNASSSGSASNPQPSLSAVVSNFTSGLTRDVDAQTAPLCSVPSTHYAAMADATLHLGVSAVVFYQTLLSAYTLFRRVLRAMHPLESRPAASPAQPLCIEMHPHRLPHTALSQMHPTPAHRVLSRVRLP